MKAPESKLTGRNIANLLPSVEDAIAFAARWQLLSKDGSHPPAPGDLSRVLRRFGLLRWRDRDLATASQSFACSLAIKPDAAKVWSDLGAVYEAQNSRDLAESCIRMSLELNEGDARCWLLLGGLLDRNQDMEGAAGAYHRSIELDDRLSDAHFGLGIIHYKKNNIERSLDHLRNCVQYDPSNAFARACLAHVLYSKGQFANSAAMFREAEKLGPLDVGSRATFARASALEGIISGQAAQALADIEDRLDGSDFSQEAFSLLSAYGYTEAAYEIGLLRLSRNPDDPIQRYLNTALKQSDLKTAPSEYIEKHFDSMAPGFDQKLMGSLEYHAPSKMIDLVSTHRDRFARIVDLGCGTGLAGKALSGFGGTLTGVDLSSRMLEHARQRGCYTDLVKEEAVLHLKNAAGYDLIFAADVLVYVGDLVDLFRQAAKALEPGGIFALSVETVSGKGFELRPSGRFAHSADYLLEIAARHFDVLDLISDTIRLELRQPVDGCYAVLKRR